MDRTTTSDSGTLSVTREILWECRAMVLHAMSSGLTVPGGLVQGLEAIVGDDEADARTSARRTEAEETTEFSAEAPHSRVRNLPSAVAYQIAQIHGQLSKIIAPAKPRTVLLLERETARGGFLKFLGPVPLIRRMMVTSVISLVALIAVSLSPEVDGAPGRFSLLVNSGTSLLLNELFLLSAAGIGASFYNLFQANRFVREGTFDPVYESSYWIRFVLGLMAGMMLASLIPIDSATAGEAMGLDADAASSVTGLEKPMFALLGGFSASVVYRILSRLVAAVESIVKGDTRDIQAAQEASSKALAAEQEVQNRLALASRLTKLQQQIQSADVPQELKRELERIQNDLLTPGSYDRES